MEFCEFCENMMYIKTNSEDVFDVFYMCKNCDHTKPLSKTSTTKVVQTFYASDEKNVLGLTQNIEFDPTIPHDHNIVCPNKECVKEKNAPNDVMYMKTDEINMKFAYYCVHCKQFWENRF